MMPSEAGFAPGPLDAAAVSEARALFERGLLAFLRDASDTSAANDMCAAVDWIEAAPKAGQQRAFWWITKAFFDAIKARALPVDIDVKKFAGRVNLQFRALSADPQSIAQSIPEKLFSEALAFIGRAQPVTGHIDAVQKMYQLRGPPAEVRVDAQTWNRADVDTPEAGIPAAATRLSDDGASSDARGEDMRKIGGLTISLPAYNAFLAEADEVLRVLARDFGEWRHELHRAGSQAALSAAHALAQSSATIGLMAVRDLAGAIEAALQASSDHPLPMTTGEIDHLQAAVDSLRAMLHRFAAQILPEKDTARIAALTASMSTRAPERGKTVH